MTFSECRIAREEGGAVSFRLTLGGVSRSIREKDGKLSYCLLSTDPEGCRAWGKLEEIPETERGKFRDLVGLCRGMLGVLEPVTALTPTGERVEIRLRDVREVQEAHDVVGLVLMEGEEKLLPEDQPVGEDAAFLHGAASALCWTLGHLHNVAFGEALRDLRGAWKRAGYRLALIERPEDIPGRGA